MNKGINNEYEQARDKLIELNVPRSIASVLPILFDGKGKTSNEIRQISGLITPECYMALNYLRRMKWVGSFPIRNGQQGRPTNVYYLKTSKMDVLDEICSAMILGIWKKTTTFFQFSFIFGEIRIMLLVKDQLLMIYQSAALVLKK